MEGIGRQQHVAEKVDLIRNIDAASERDRPLGYWANSDAATECSCLLSII
jgi:hypothetical protein